MSEKGKLLRLVHPAQAAPDGAPRDVAQTGSLVRAASGKAELEPADHEALIALVLGDEAASVTEQELHDAEQLRLALDRLLEGGETPGQSEPLLDVARALRATRGTSELGADANERLLWRAMSRAGAGARARRVARLRPATRVAVGALCALCAGVALFVGSLASVGPRGGARPVAGRASPAPPALLAPATDLVPVRSTQALFDPTEPFPRRGGETARIDRIASARAADLRTNRFAAWGVP
ncbi:MAG: hypothetical protein HY744_17360 [Deltaproteobacteria bacterium]|nr:hypothetical protein [Deltaproteobacteria bacterium]